MPQKLGKLMAQPFEWKPADMTHFTITYCPGFVDMIHLHTVLALFSKFDAKLGGFDVQERQYLLIHVAILM